MSFLSKFSQIKLVFVGYLVTHPPGGCTTSPARFCKCHYQLLDHRFIVILLKKEMLACTELSMILGFFASLLYPLFHSAGCPSREGRKQMSVLDSKFQILQRCWKNRERVIIKAPKCNVCKRIRQGLDGISEPPLNFKPSMSVF